MVSIDELRKELEEEKKKIKDSAERRKLKFQINIAKSPVKRSIVGGVKVARKGLVKTGQFLRAEGLRRQKILDEDAKRKKLAGQKITKSVRKIAKKQRKRGKKKRKQIRKAVVRIVQQPKPKPTLRESIFQGI